MIPGINGLRAMAVLALFSFHVDGYNLGFGWQGVQFFFVLSGFLITGILLRMKETLPARQYFYKFYGRRFLRIFPLYYFYLFILSIAISQSDLLAPGPLKDELQNVVQVQIPYAYFYVYDFFYASAAYQVTSFLTHFWSLAVEEQFYILWPLLIYYMPKTKVKGFLLIAIILGPIFRLMAFFLYRDHPMPFMLENPHLAIYALPFSHVDAFAMGAYISHLQIPNSRKQMVLLACVIPLLGYFTQYLAAGIIDPGTLGYEFKMFTAYKFVWGYSLLNYFFALVIQNVQQSRVFLPVLEHFTVDFVGRISYGVYVYHLPVIWFVVTFSYEKYSRQPFYMTWVYLIALLLTLGISSLSFYLLEKPASDLKDRLFPLDAK